MSIYSNIPAVSRKTPKNNKSRPAVKAGAAKLSFYVTKKGAGK
jgi:hypothetical protein